MKNPIGLMQIKETTYMHIAHDNHDQYDLHCTTSMKKKEVMARAMAL